jgi:hypothetical protein
MYHQSCYKPTQKGALVKDFKKASKLLLWICRHQVSAQMFSRALDEYLRLPYSAPKLFSAQGNNQHSID